MNKTTGRVAAGFLAVVLCMALSVSAFAADEKIIVPLNPDDIVEYTEVVSQMPTIDLGTPDTIIFDNSPNIMTRASGFLFSMTANSVQDLLVTGSAKTFKNSDLDNGYLHITGNLNHTKGASAKIKIGGCYYNSATGTYKADVYTFVYEGDIAKTISTRYTIAQEYTHRGFIKNEYGSGIVSGDLSFWSQE